MRSRRNSAVALAAVLLLAAPAWGAEREDGFAATYREALLEVATRLHYDLAYVDVDAVVQKALRLRQRGMSEAELLAREAVEGEAMGSFHGFMPRGAVHSPHARYMLPFPRWLPHLVAQGNGGPYTHKGPRNHHAFDFALAPGTPVLAARAGTVMRIVDGFPPGDELPPGLPGPIPLYSNQVLVLHGDGTVGEYSHLGAGIKVVVGQSVTPQDVLAHSGASGSPEGPHLHFAVVHRAADGSRRSLPVGFGPKRLVPKETDVVGSPPRPTIPLRVTFQGRPLQGNDTVVLPRGGEARLKVEAQIGAGFTDVTEHAHVHYHSITPWSVVVDRRGLVRMAYGPGYERSPDENRDMGRVLVFYADRAAGHFGHLLFELRTK